MKLSQILERDLPTKKWIKATDKDLAEYKEIIFDMIQQSYAYIGGHPNIKSPNDIKNEGGQYFEINDVSGDDEPDVVSITKDKKAGHKFVAGATDGTKEAKREYVKSRIDKLKKSGYYIEVSGRIADIFKNAGVHVVDDEETVRKALAGKDIKWLGKGEYERKIGGKSHKKLLMGFPKV